MKNENKNERIKQMPYWLCAFIVSLLTATAAILPMLIKNNGYMAMSHDFAAEEISYNIMMNKAVKSGNILWNWGIDIGSNFIETFSFYSLGSPFLWLTLLFPASMVPRLMGPVMILKFAVAGMISSVYFNRHLKSRKLVVLASVLYAFSGFQCASVVFYHFQDPVAFFPLLLIGVEKLVEEKKHGWLAIGVMVNALCNYVFFFAEVIFIVIFYVIKYLVPQLAQMLKGKKKNVDIAGTTKTSGMSDESADRNSSNERRLWEIIKPVLMCMLEGIIGVAMAGFILLPSVNGTMSNSRISQHISTLSWFTMSTKNWLMLIKAFFLPGETMNALVSVEYSDWMTNAAYLPLFGAVFVVAYMISKKDWLANMLKVGALCAAVPLLNSAFSFFSDGAYRRWYYMLILLMALATAKVIEEHKEYKVKKAAIISGILLVFFLVMVLMMNREEGVIGIYKKNLFIASFLIGIAGPVFVIALPRFMKNQVNNLHGIYIAAAVMVSAVTLGVTISEYAKATDNTNQDFKTYGASYGENVYAYLAEIPEQLDAEVLPYRYYFDEGIGHTYYNLAMTNQLPSINSFCSTVHSSIGEYYDEIGLGRATWTNAGPDGIRELLGARYVISCIEQPDYTYIRDYTTSTGQTLKFYENENALPLGFTYDMYMTRSDFKGADNYLKPAIMLRMLIIEDEDEEVVSRYLRKYDPYIDGGISYENVSEYAQAHQQESSESFTCGKNYFESIITADGDKYAFFAVPYDKSWKATVNGSETQILNINGLMAVKVSQGSNEIRFDYVYKPLKYGIVLSIVGVIGWVVYVFMAAKMRKDKSV